VDTAIKILMAVVIGALVLGGLYALFGETVLPT
jgi:lipopolysaccharide export LptBFGC system permease protein LptF